MTWKAIDRMRPVLLCLTTLLILVLTGSAEAGKVIYVGRFSQANLDKTIPHSWEPLTFNNIASHTRYTLVKDNDVLVVKAVSKASASGLIRKIRIDPAQYPFIQWRWKVSNLYEKGDITRKDGDDYPARIYIAFDRPKENISFFQRALIKSAKLLYGDYPAGGAISYIRTGKAPVGTIAPNPYTNQVKMIVVDSGKERLNHWVEVKRNVVDDYRRAFGVKPPMITGVALMTDSDDTKESAVAFYGDIVFLQDSQMDSSSE